MVLTESRLTEAGNLRGLEAGSNRVTEDHGVGGGGGGGGVATITAHVGNSNFNNNDDTLVLPVLAGQTIIAVVEVPDSQTATLTDSQSNTWSLRKTSGVFYPNATITWWEATATATGTLTIDTGVSGSFILWGGAAWAITDGVYLDGDGNGAISGSISLATSSAMVGDNGLGLAFAIGIIDDDVRLTTPPDVVHTTFSSPQKSYAYGDIALNDTQTLTVAGTISAADAWGAGWALIKAVGGPELFDDWTGTDGAAWDSAKWLASYSNATAANPDISSNRGRMAVGGGGYRSMRQAYNMSAVEDVDVLISFATDSTIEAYAGITIRADGAWGGDGEQSWPNQGYTFQYEATTGSIELHKYTTGIRSTIGTMGGAVSASKRWLRVQAIGTKIRAKSWMDGNAEPLTWGISVTDSTITSGIVVLTHFNGSGSDVRTVYWDDLTITVDPPVFFDDFEAYTVGYLGGGSGSANWAVQFGGDYQIYTGLLGKVAPTVGNYTGVRYKTELGVDMWMEMDVDWASPTGGYRELDLFGRWDTTNQRGYQIAVTSNGTIEIFVIHNGGGYSSLGNVAAPGGIGNGTLRAEIVGNSISAWWNGTFALTVTDSTYATGTYGGMASYQDSPLQAYATEWRGGPL